MVAANGAAASDDHGTSSDGAPGHDTPAGSGTLLGGAAKKPSPTRKPAVGRAGPREQSEATAKLPMTGAQEPAPNQDPRRLAADQTTYGVKTQPAVAPAVSTESVSVSDGDWEPALTSVAVAYRPGGQVSAATAKTPALVLNAAAIDAKPDAGSADGGTAAASPRPAPVESILPPALRPRPRNPDVAVPADEMTVRAAVPAPVELPPANPDPTDLSGRRAGTMQVSAPPSRRSSGSAVAQVLALSGQMPRTADSISPAEPAPRPVETAAGTGPPPEQRATAQPAMSPKAAPQNLAESLDPAGDTEVRVLAASTPDRDEVAFALRMKAMPAPEDAVQRESPVRLAAAEGSRRISVPTQQGEVPAPEPAAAASEKRPSLAGTPDPAPARAGRERHPEAAPAEPTETPPATPAGKMIPHAEPDTQVRAETAPERTDTTAAKPVRPQDAMESETKPEAAKATSVRDMKFEVTGGERRVEVRLSERAGEVKMTVRTADAPLASTLRENLPALTARLAESGFKSQAWHPAASSPNELRHTAESSAGGAAHDTNQDANADPREPDREPQDGAGQRRPKSPQEAAPQKEKGRDFAWLISSLR